MILMMALCDLKELLKYFSFLSIKFLIVFYFKLQYIKFTTINILKYNREMSN